MTDENVSGGEDSLQRQLLQMMTGYWVSKAIYVAAKLGLADLVSASPSHYQELAGKTGTHASSLYRLLRALASVGIFSETDGEHFALTPLASLLQTGRPESMRALAIMYNEEQFEAWGDLLHSVKAGQTAFKYRFGAEVYSYFREHPAASSVFNEAMTSWTTRVASAAANACDFYRFRTVVDVGGNQGILLAAILRAHPGVKGILFDLPDVVANANAYLSAMGVDDRCTVTGGDLFSAIPSGGDVYVLSGVLHGFDDERARAVLTQCRKAMPSNGRLLVLEYIIPERDEPSFGKWLDLHMLVMSGGRERSKSEFEDLLRAGGFRLLSVSNLPTDLCLAEAEPI